MAIPRGLKFYCILGIIITCYSISVPAEDENQQNDRSCRKLKGTSFPEADRPKKEELAKFNKCDSEAYFYGIGRPVDYVKARLCAFAEVEDERRVDDRSQAYQGSAILLMIYANGLGTSANIALAEKMACESYHAPAEIESALNDLESRKKDSGAGIFVFSSHFTSGYMGGLGAKHEDRIEKAQRVTSLASLVAQMSQEDKAAFEKLKGASDKFTQERSSQEVDLSGTMRAAFEIEEGAIQERDFIESLQKLEDRTAPKYSSSQLKAEDKKLNDLYQAIQNDTRGDSGEVFGTVTKQGIKETQRAWLKYRDAWVEFGKKRYKKYSSESIAAWFTKKRNHMLSQFAPKKEKSLPR